ncbi:hypothetical protein [Clostridium perfringens]|uniref:hypothetical protein n=1 Tax=Clostridium perfringens TaxID=1502 RepID=UPI0023F6DB3B|nr:hypothetical protein [Clostridium perfringens]WEV18188.1 hypothetical protein PL323_11120 [Clostridium perfringens D]
MSNKEKIYTRGRAKVYTDKVLMDIIEQYLISNPDTTELVANRIAKYAQENLGFNNIRYSQFKACQLTNTYIEKFNVEHLKVIPTKKIDKNKPLRINTDALIDKYIHNPAHLRTALRQFGDKYNDMCKESIANIGKVHALNSKIQELQTTISELQLALKKVKKEKAELNKEKAILTQKAIHGDKISTYLTSIDVYGDLVSKCKANPIDEINLKIILYNAGLLKDTEHLDITNYLDKISDANLYHSNSENHTVENKLVTQETTDLKSEDDYINLFKNIINKN